MQDETKELTIREVAQRGGEATKEKYGREHYVSMGLVGGAKNKMKGQKYFKTIGKEGGKALKITIYVEDSLEDMFAVRGRKNNPRRRPLKLKREDKRTREYKEYHG